MDDTSNVKLKPPVQKNSNEIIQSSLANESSTTNNNNRAKTLKHLLLLQPPPPPPPLSSSNALLTPRKESIKVTLVNENETNTQLLLTSNPIATGKPAMSILDVIAKAKANKAASTSSLGGGGGGNGNVSPTTAPTSIPTNTTTTPRSPRDFDNPNERLKSKLAKKNWQTVMNVAVVKEMGGGGLSGGGGDMMNRIDNIYATNAENWTFVSIIITVVTFLSILICFLVYIFFHKFRT